MNVTMKFSYWSKSDKALACGFWLVNIAEGCIFLVFPLLFAMGGYYTGSCRAIWL
jgi:hypothetical protein